MELNMEYNEKRTGEQVLESALSALGDSACAHTRKWVQGIRGLRSLTRGTVWDRATEAADQQRSLNGAQSDETTAVVLWWGSDEPPLPDKFQSGPDHSGRQWTLERQHTGNLGDCREDAQVHVTHMRRTSGPHMWAREQETTAHLTEPLGGYPTTRLRPPSRCPPPVPKANY